MKNAPFGMSDLLKGMLHNKSIVGSLDVSLYQSIVNVAYLCQKDTLSPIQTLTYMYVRSSPYKANC